MIGIIEILQREHRNIEKLLDVIEQELGVFDRGEHPDYEVLGAVIDYFRHYPDTCHHPKEDLIYEKFKSRDPAQAKLVANLRAEHREGAARLRRAAHAIDNVLNDQDLLRDTVDRIVRDFVDGERKHIALEEREVFPAIVKALKAADWAEIALTLADRYGVPSQPAFEARFSALCRNILDLEKAAAADRQA
jgi:hemerythrin-like domain-containing protein